MRKDKDDNSKKIVVIKGKKYLVIEDSWPGPAGSIHYASWLKPLDEEEN